MGTRHFLATALGAALFVTTGSALADGLHSRWEGSRISFDTDIWPGQDFVLSAMAINGQVELHRHFALDFNVAWAAGNIDLGGGGRETGAGFGNITIGGHTMFHLGPDALVTGGLTLSIPTRYDFEDAGTGAFVQLLAAGGRGFFDLYRLYPGTLFVRIPLGAEVRFADYFYYRGDFNPVIAVPVAKNFNSDPVVIIEHSDEIEARTPFGFGGGLRFQLAIIATNSAPVTTSGAGPDHAQTALEPFIGYEPRSGFFARLGCLVALDTPLGFGFETDKMATVRITLGGKF